MSEDTLQLYDSVYSALCIDSDVMVCIFGNRAEDLCVLELLHDQASRL